MRILLLCSVCIGVISFGGAWADPPPLPPEELPLSEATLSLRRIEPPAGSEMSGETVVRAVVHYEIKPFHRNDKLYSADLQFDLEQPGKSVSVVSYEKYRNRIFLESATGTFEIEYPVSYVRRRHDLASPITLRVTLHQATGEKTNQIIGRSQAVAYSVGPNW